MSAPYIIIGVVADVVPASGVEAADGEDAGVCAVTEVPDSAGDCAPVAEVPDNPGAWADVPEVPNCA